MWPTPTSLSFADSHQPGNCASHNEMMRLHEQWMTPNVTNGGRSAAHANLNGKTFRTDSGKKVQLGLEHQVKNWGTLRATDGEKGGPNMSFTGGASASGTGGVIFAPGPSDERWPAILDRAPQLEPAVRRMADGLADRVDRLRACGNGVVPLVAAYAWRSLDALLGEAREAGAFVVRAA
jgi:hypothetical protein